MFLHCNEFRILILTRTELGILKYIFSIINIHTYSANDIMFYTLSKSCFGG